MSAHGLVSSQSQGLGGIPTDNPDVWANGLFLIVFTVCAGSHFALFKWNARRRQRKFAFSLATTGFCLTRVITTCLRTAWAYHPQNARLALADEIFLYAGVIILIVSNLWWSQRILRAQHPYFGWSIVPSGMIAVVLVVCTLTLLALVISVCVQFYVYDDLAHSVTKGIQQYALTLFAVLAVLPFPILFVSFVAKSHPDLKERRVDNFGKRTIETKTLVCFATAFLLSTGAVFRATVNFAPLLPLTGPTPWYLSKTCFYLFNFTLEAVVVILWLLVRVDKLFVVPNGSHGPYSYGNGTVFAGEEGNEKINYLRSNTRANVVATHYDGHPTYTRWSSSTTIPPITRPESWGSARKYMVDDPVEIASPRPSWDGQSGTATRIGTPSAWSGTNQIKRGRSYTNDTTGLKVYTPTVWSDARTHQNGGDTHTAPSEALYKPSLDLPQPPAAVCIRCLNCGGSNNRAPSPQPSQHPCYNMGFDPQQGRWIKRPVSASYSASEYSVRETLCSPDPNRGKFLPKISSDHNRYNNATGGLQRHNTTTQYSVRETLRPTSSTACCSPDMRRPSTDRAKFANFSSPDLRRTHASTFTLTSPCMSPGGFAGRFSRKPSVLQGQQQQQRGQCGVTRAPSNLEFRTRESIEQFRQFNFRNSPEIVC